MKGFISTTAPTPLGSRNSEMIYIIAQCQALFSKPRLFSFVETTSIATSTFVVSSQVIILKFLSLQNHHLIRSHRSCIVIVLFQAIFSLGNISSCEIIILSCTIISLCKVVSSCKVINSYKVIASGKVIASCRVKDGKSGIIQGDGFMQSYSYNVHRRGMISSTFLAGSTCKSRTKKGVLLAAAKDALSDMAAVVHAQSQKLMHHCQNSSCIIERAHTVPGKCMPCQNISYAL